MAERALGQRPVGDEECSHRVLRRTVTMALIVVGWVLFPSPDLGHAVAFLGAMVSTDMGWKNAFDLGRRRELAVLCVGLATIALPGRFSGWRLVTRDQGLAAGAARVVLLLVMVPYAVLAMASGSFSPFLYFRF